MSKLTFGLFVFLLVFPSIARADSAAPEMFGVREVIINNASVPDVKAADACGGISRETMTETLVKAFEGTSVPAISYLDAKPPSLGVARIELNSEVYTRTNEDLECVSWISITATSHANLVVPPVNTLRSVTILYWHQRAMVASGQSIHPHVVKDLLQRMATEFAQQYRLDQPPELK